MIKKILIINLFFGLIFQNSYSKNSEIDFGKNHYLMASLSYLYPFSYFNFTYQYNLLNDLSFSLNTEIMENTTHEISSPYTGYQGNGFKINPEVKYYSTSSENYNFTRLYLSSGLYYRSSKIKSSQWVSTDSFVTNTRYYKYASTKENEFGMYFRAGMEFHLDPSKRLILDLSAGYGMGYLNKKNNGDEIHFTKFKAETNELFNLSGGFKLGIGYYLFPLKK